MIRIRFCPRQPEVAVPVLARVRPFLCAEKREKWHSVLIGSGKRVLSPNLCQSLASVSNCACELVWESFCARHRAMSTSTLCHFTASPRSVRNDCSSRLCVTRRPSVALPRRSIGKTALGSVRSERRLTVRAADGDSAVVVEEQARTSSSGVADWEAFSAQVSGEWDGYSAEFNFAGEPFQLPGNVVPDAFREWGVEVHDWQTQCPTLAHPEPGHLWYKVIRLHPTVGCEADAATVYGVEKCSAPENAAALACHSSTGSYTIVWRGKRVTREQLGTGPGTEVFREGDEVQVEQCLVHERKRIRVLQHLDARRRVMVFREAWEGPFRNGESLGGCAVGTPAFATREALQASALAGAWRTDVYSAQNLQPQQGYTSSELVWSGVGDVDRLLPDSTLYLPLDTWTSLWKSESGGTVAETGWLVKPDEAVVSVCEFESSGDLKSVSLRREKRISGD